MTLPSAVRGLINVVTTGAPIPEVRKLVEHRCAAMGGFAHVCLSVETLDAEKAGYLALQNWH